MPPKPSTPKCRVCGCSLRSDVTKARGVCRFNACINDAVKRGILTVGPGGQLQPAATARSPAPARAAGAI